MSPLSKEQSPIFKENLPSQPLDILLMTILRLKNTDTCAHLKQHLNYRFKAESRSGPGGCRRVNTADAAEDAELGSIRRGDEPSDWMIDKQKHPCRRRPSTRIAVLNYAEAELQNTRRASRT